jgi:hypothetical protein
MAPLAIGTVIQTLTIPCAQRLHKFRLTSLQDKQNTTPAPLFLLIRGISGHCFKPIVERNKVQREVRMKRKVALCRLNWLDPSGTID